MLSFAIPEFDFGSTTIREAVVDDEDAVDGFLVPPLELYRHRGVVAGIEKAQQGGGLEGAGSLVEREGHQGDPLSLSERHTDVAVHAGDGSSQVGSEELARALRGDAEALGYIRAGVADTDSQGAVCVGIRDKPLAFDSD